MVVKVGDKVLVFVLNNIVNEKVVLSDYEGKNFIVLFFFFVFMSVCIEELCIMCDNMVEY